MGMISKMFENLKVFIVLIAYVPNVHYADAGNNLEKNLVFELPSCHVSVRKDDLRLRRK